MYESQVPVFVHHCGIDKFKTLLFEVIRLVLKIGTEFPYLLVLNYAKTSYNSGPLGVWCHIRDNQIKAIVGDSAF